MEKKEVSKKTLLKSGFWYTAAFFLSRAMVFLTMPLFTRLMTKAQYGDFSVFVNWQSTLLVICGLEVYGTINRARFDFDGEGELDGYISSCLVLSTLFTAFIFVLYLIFPHLFDQLFLIERRYMMIMFAYLFTYPAFAMFHAKQRINYKYKTSTAVAFSALILSYALSVSLVLLYPEERLFGRIFGQYILYILTSIVLYILFLYKSRKITLKAWKYALQISLPLVFAYLGSHVLLSSDTFILKHMCSSEEVSIISITHSCSHIVMLLVRAVNGAWLPYLYDMLKVEKYGVIRKIFQIYLWFVIACTFAVVLIGPEVISLLGGEKYAESIYTLPGYILCGVFSVLTTQFSNLETYHKKTKYAAIFTAIAAVLNLGLNIVGVKLWGYQAVCYATVISQLVLIALHYIFTVRLGIRDILPLKMMLIPLAASLLIIPSALLLYQNNIVRYIVIALTIAAAAVVLVVKRQDIKAIVKRFKKMA